MTKEIIIIALIVLAIYLYYQQNNLATAPVEGLTNPEIQELKTQLNHYQTLYQKRVEKDIETESAQIQQLTLNNQQLANNLSQETQTKNLYSQKVESLENQLINLAKSKIKGKKDAENLVRKLESNWQSDKDLWKTTETNYLEKLENLTQDQQQKEQTIIGLNNSYDKLETKEKYAQKQIANLNQKAEQHIKHIDQQKEIYSEKVQELENTLQTHQQTIANLNRRNQAKQEQISTLQQDNQSKQSQISLQTQAITTKTTRLTRQQEIIEKQQDQLAQQKEAIEQLLTNRIDHRISLSSESFCLWCQKSANRLVPNSQICYTCQNKGPLRVSQEQSEKTKQEINLLKELLEYDN